MQTEHQTIGSLTAITGAADGLGKAFAVECASRGWNLLLVDVNQAGLETLAEGIRRAYGVTVLTHVCDLTDAAA
ncbi:MAG: SDR family NAD(P)-dependent oxidoreductase, partial [Anaerolineaceae bacterium]